MKIDKLLKKFNKAENVTFGILVTFFILLYLVIMVVLAKLVI